MTVGGRLAFLDCLRGWAALSVILYHTALIPTPALQIPAWVAPVVLDGGTGVTLFFIASAFSLCRAARPGEERGRELAAYAIRRLFRIAPLFYAILAVSIVRDVWVFAVWHGAPTVIANALFVFNLWPGHETGIVWASWTIGVEVLFYGVFPLLASRVKTVAAASIVVLLCLSAAALWPLLLHLTSLPQDQADAQAQFGVLRQLPLFAMGVLAYRVFERYIEPRGLPWQAGGALLAAALYSFVLMWSGRLTAPPFHDVYFWPGAIYSLVVLGLAIYPVRILVNGVMTFLGRVSYSLYLLHPLIVYALIPVYRTIQNRGWPVTLSFGLCFVLTIGLTVTASIVTNRLIEVPGMRLGGRLANRLTNRDTIGGRLGLANISVKPFMRP